MVKYMHTLILEPVVSSCSHSKESIHLSIDKFGNCGATTRDSTVKGQILTDTNTLVLCNTTHGHIIILIVSTYRVELIYKLHLAITGRFVRTLND
jgi:hypothetical protein